MMTMIISGSDGVTFPDSTNQFSGGAFSFKNRIINGDMRIDQRNAGAAVTINSSPVFFIDRYSSRNNGGGWGSGALSAQRSSTAPAGFTNSMSLTVSTADASISSTDAYIISQLIEGYNIADFGWGTANAKTVTLSFWVRSSLTGTFAGSITNDSNNRAYVFTYTISAADTWEYKTVTIAGDTTGTWYTDNQNGLRLNFDVGSGSDRNGTANTWQASGASRTSSAVQLIGTLNATWYITGVQLEVGSVATPFERRPYGTELALCQRYYYKNFPALSNSGLTPSFNGSTTQSVGTGFFPVQMRVRPTALEQTGTASDYLIAHRATSTVCSSVPTYDSVTNQNLYTVVFTVSSGLTAGDGSQARTNSTSGFLAWSAEL